MSNNKKPAILGGVAVFEKPLKSYNSIGEEERVAVDKVMRSGRLSGYLGSWSPEFYGGSKVRELEDRWAQHFQVKNAIAVNSWTSGLYAILGAIGIEPGDEVIVTPTTMTASVAGIVLYQAIPIFVDISPDTFCIEPNEIIKKITSKTKAIIGVDIYGETADWDIIQEISKRKNIFTIEDAAQSIGGLYNGRKSGTLADVGGYSLNRHKHIHCGEGGMCVTDNDEFAERIRLIRNHGEAVVDEKGTININNIIGFNFRMTELQAAITIEQLKKLDDLVDERINICESIIDAFSGIDGIDYPKLYSGTSTITKHVYYYLCFKIDSQKLGITRKQFIQALAAEGLPFGEGGYMPVYLQSMYQKKIAFGSKGHPFTANTYGKEISYNKGLCPVSERMWFEELFYFQIQNYVPNKEEIKKFKSAIDKVLENKQDIKKYLEDKYD